MFIQDKICIQYKIVIQYMKSLYNIKALYNIKPLYTNTMQSCLGNEVYTGLKFCLWLHVSFNRFHHGMKSHPCLVDRDELIPG